ncbi:MAG: pilus assembly protein, partial [Nakamurella sp.]
NDAAVARTAVRNATSLSPALTNAQIVFSPTTCTTGATVAVTVTYPMDSATGFFKGMFTGKTLQGRATMKCNG